jgi:PAP2 superfamily
MSRIAVASVVAGSLIVLGGAARADAVMDWNNLAAVVSEAEGMAHPESATKWSPKEDAEEIVAVAIFQAVNTIQPLYTPAREALAPPVGEASLVAAVAGAAHAALVTMFSEQKTVLDDDFAVMLADLPAGPARAAGIEVGERAAAQVVGWRTADHAPSAPPIRIAAPPGHWVPTTPNKIPAYYATAKPWLLSSPSQFRPKPPITLVSDEWAHDYNETRSLGGRNSAARTAEWTNLATFYSQWQQWPLVRQVAAMPGRTLEQNARLYAMVAMATADADTAMVDGKLTYSFWRPITAIRNGDQDGNAATERDADWEPLLKTPMHPEYPCGHCVVISAVTTVLAAEGPPPPGGIAVMSDAMPGVVRYVESWPKLAEEVSLSRIYAGAHFRHSMEVGAALGRRVAEYELQGFLKPKRE